MAVDPRLIAQQQEEIRRLRAEVADMEKRIARDFERLVQLQKVADAALELDRALTFSGSSLASSEAAVLRGALMGLEDE